jgi:hypothetical protein
MDRIMNPWRYGADGQLIASERAKDEQRTAQTPAPAVEVHWDAPAAEKPRPPGFPVLRPVEQ